MSDRARRAGWEELQAVIYDNLEAEYNYVMELQKTYGTLVAPKMSFFMTLSPAQYIVKMHHPVLRRVKQLNIAAEMDLKICISRTDDFFCSG